MSNEILTQWPENGRVISALRLIQQSSAEGLRLHLDETNDATWQTLELSDAIDRLMDRYTARQVLNAVKTAAKARGIE